MGEEMGKRWTDEEKAIMKDHYETARAVKDVAKMLRRTVFSVVKKGKAMGLKRPDLHDLSIDRLKGVLTEVPQSSAEIAKILGMGRTSVCAMLRRGCAEGICHVAGLRHVAGRGRAATLWVAGPEDSSAADRERELAEREALRKVHAAKPFKAFRDPLVSAFYGEAA